MESDADDDSSDFVPLLALVNGWWNLAEGRMNRYEESGGTPEECREKYRNACADSRVSIGTLATWIQERGVFTYDRFYRYVQAEDESVDSRTSSRHPLSALARYLELTVRPLSLLSYDEQKELYCIADDDDSILRDFGWSQKDLQRVARMGLGHAQGGPIPAVGVTFHVTDRGRRDPLDPVIDSLLVKFPDTLDYAAVWNAFFALASQAERPSPLLGVAEGEVKFQGTSDVLAINRDAFTKRLKRRAEKRR